MVQLHIYVFFFFFKSNSHSGSDLQSCSRGFLHAARFSGTKARVKKGQSSFYLVLRTEKLLGIVI